MTLPTTRITGADYLKPFSAPLRPYEFDGRLFHDRSELARAFWNSPESGAKHLYGQTLETWLAAFDQTLALKVGDIREALAQTMDQDRKAVRRVTFCLDPGFPFTAHDGTQVASLDDLRRVFELHPESLVEHFRDLDDGIWDFLWCRGLPEQNLVSLSKMLESNRSERKFISRMRVWLSANVIRPFEGSRFAGTELKTLAELNGLAVELRARFLMDLEDANGLLVAWLEDLSGKEFPAEWKSKTPDWPEAIRYWTEDNNGY